MREHPATSSKGSRIIISRSFAKHFVVASTGLFLLLEGTTAWANEPSENPNAAGMVAMQSGRPEDALAIWSEHAESGDAVAQSNLAGLLLTPALGGPDFERAVYWFRKAAAQDNVSALVSLGHLNRVGVDAVLEPNRAAAIRYFQRGNDLGSAEAAYFFGELSLKGPEGAGRQEAVAAISRAAKAGYAPAMHRIGTFLHSGAHTERNVDKAFEWYKAAAEAGFAESRYKLGEIHMNGDHGPVDFAAALEQFGKAAASGHAEALEASGFILLNGLAGTAKPELAAQRFKKAAELWNYPAMYHLGLQYYHGTGVEQDILEAHKWFNLAASGGHGEAHYMRSAAAAALGPDKIERARDLAQTWFDQNHDTPHTHESLERHSH